MEKLVLGTFLSGSQLYGNAHDKSDTDIISIYLEAPEDFYKRSKSVQEKKDNIDYRIWDFRSFIKGLQKGSILHYEVLFTGQNNLIHPLFSDFLYMVQDHLYKNGVSQNNLTGFIGIQKNHIKTQKQKNHNERIANNAISLIKTGKFDPSKLDLESNNSELFDLYHNLRYKDESFEELINFFKVEFLKLSIKEYSK